MKLKEYAQDQARFGNSKDTRSDILRKVVSMYNGFDATMKKMLVPLVTESRIKSWLDTVLIQKNSSTSKIPIDIRSPNGIRWIWEIHRNDDYTFFSTIKQENQCYVIGTLLIDGTFDSCPKGFAKLLNLMGYDASSRRYLPLVHVLMKDRKKSSYCEVFKVITAFIEFDQLSTIIMYFEKAEIAAIETIFKRKYPTIELQGCFFHFSKAIHRNLVAIYGKEKWELEMQTYEVAFKLLPLISDHDYKNFIKYMKKDTKIKRFFEYFLRTWGPKGQYPRILWKVIGKKNQQKCTNNGNERYNRESNKYLDNPAFNQFARQLFDLDQTIYDKAELSRNQEHLIISRCIENRSLDARGYIMRHFKGIFIFLLIKTIWKKFLEF